MNQAEDLVIGLDVGTSGLKCVLVDLQGSVHGSSLHEYLPDSPQPGWAEQDPEVWLQSAESAIRDVLQQSRVNSKRIMGLGLAGQMHSTIVLDRERNPIRPAILWLDRRSTQQVAQIRDRFEASLLARWIGNPIMAGTALTTLLWLLEKETESFERIEHILLPKDYLRHRLTGNILATDMSDASSTLLFRTGDRLWCDELLEFVELRHSQLPEVLSSTSIAGTLLQEVATRVGLVPGLPVVCGAGDQEAQAVANGITNPGLVSCTIGTGGQVFTPLTNYTYDPKLRLNVYCHAIPSQWHWLAATMTAGLSLRWFKSQVLMDRYSYEEIANSAAEITPGANGLIFLPYLAGERTPHMDPRARGVFFGLTMNHHWQHMARAIMEGVVLSIREGLELISATGTPIRRVVSSGGGAKHPLWLQLQADIFGVEVARAGSDVSAALGAAILTAVGIGAYKDIFEACKHMVTSPKTPIKPRDEVSQLYDDIFLDFKGLYTDIGGRFSSSYHLYEA